VTIPIGKVADSFWTGLTKGVLGDRPVFSMWIVVGAISSYFVLAAAFTTVGTGSALHGFTALAITLDWLGFPSNVADFVRSTDQWVAERKEIVSSASGLAIIVAVGYMCLRDGTVYVFPASPSPATFFVSLLFWQSAGFYSWIPIAVITAIVIFAAFLKAGSNAVVGFFAGIVSVVATPLVISSSLFARVDR